MSPQPELGNTPPVWLRWPFRPFREIVINRYGFVELRVLWHMVTRGVPGAASTDLGAITKYWPSEKIPANSKIAAVRTPFEAKLKMFFTT